jgi:hypothetical protein
MNSTTLNDQFLDTITGRRLFCGELEYPNKDGNDGQVVTTDGKGKLSFQTPLSGQGSSTNNAIARFSGTSGTVLKDSLATIDNSGLLTTPFLNVGSLNYPATPGLNGTVISQLGSNLTLVRDFNQVLYATVSSAPIITDIAVGDHIKFASIYFQTNTLVCVLDTSSPYTSTLNTNSVGRILCTEPTLLKAYVTDLVLTSNTDFIELRWINADTGVISDVVGNISKVGVGPSGLNWTIGCLPVEALVLPAVPSRYELRIISLSSPLISYGNIIVEGYSFKNF